MKRLFLAFGFLSSLSAFGGSTTPATPTIYLAARTDGAAGSGTQADPYNVSTTSKFDAFFGARYASHFVSYLSQDPVIFQFAAGTYSTSGINAVSGWQLLGAGQSSTIINLVGLAYPSATAKEAYQAQALQANWGSSNIVVKNLTFDGGTRATGTPLAQGFVMPPARGYVNVSVTNSANLTVGKWYYVQDTAMTNGYQQWWGFVTCTAISGNTVTLQNAQVATAGTVTGDVTAGSPVVRNVSSTTSLEQWQMMYSSSIPGGQTNIASVDSPSQFTLGYPVSTTANQVTFSYANAFSDNGTGAVPATAYLFPAGCRCGIMLQSNNITVQDVTVQDVAVPFYEGAAGIELGNSAVLNKAGTGNLIDSCTVKDMFGIYSAYIAANSINNQTGNDGTTEQVNITNNTVDGNGYYNGIGLAGNSNCTISGNTISNVQTCLFCDTGYNTGMTITNNAFSGAGGIYLGVGGSQFYQNTTIKNNTVTLTSTNGTGIALSLNASNIAITNNIITIGSADDGAAGISIQNLAAGASGDTAINNQIASSLRNTGINNAQNQILAPNVISQDVLSQTDTNGVQGASNSSSSSSMTTTNSGTTSTGTATSSSSSSGTTSSKTSTTSTTSTSSKSKLTPAQLAAQAAVQASLLSHTSKTPTNNKAAVTPGTSETSAAERLSQSLFLTEESGTTTSGATTTASNEAQEKAIVQQLNALVQQMAAAQ